MVPKQWLTRISDILNKYRYALIILVIGLLLMALPNFGLSTKSSEGDPEGSAILPVESFEDRLARLLSKVEGAGAVEVILTVAAGKETIYQTNDEHSNSGIKANTVTVTDSNRDQSGLVKQVKNEVYKGAVIVCQGANDPSVRLALVDAVSRITGLGANSISVLKMK